MQELRNLKLTIAARKGASFRAYKGALFGKVTGVSPRIKLVLDWACTMPKWPKKHFSRCTFSLKRKGRKTQLSLYQSGIPLGSVKDITKGWHSHYWNPMKKLLEKQFS